MEKYREAILIQISEYTALLNRVKQIEDLENSLSHVNKEIEDKITNISLLTEEKSKLEAKSFELSGQVDRLKKELIPSLDKIKLPKKNRVVDVSTSRSHCLILTEEGEVWSLGDNKYGELGLGDNDSRKKATKVSLSSRAKYVSVGEKYSIILTVDGSLFSFGRNNKNQLLLGSYKLYPNSPELTKLTENISIVSAGAEHCLAITEWNNLISWGCNCSGELGGLGGNEDIVTVGSEFNTIRASYHYSVASKMDGSTYAWGRNNFGQLGVGDTNNRETPTQIIFSEGYFKLMKFSHECVVGISDLGKCYVWGKFLNMIFTSPVIMQYYRERGNFSFSRDKLGYGEEIEDVAILDSQLIYINEKNKIFSTKEESYKLEDIPECESIVGTGEHCFIITKNRELWLYDEKKRFINSDTSPTKIILE